ncbi:MAG: hypothetical protein AB1772_05250 [Candidatus Zixiibacteriota bacterium]
MSKKRNRRTPGDSDSTDGFWLFKFGTKLLLTVVIVLLALSLMQCTIRKPESPTWNTQLVLPLINRTYTMSEIVDKIDQEGVSIDADSNVIFFLTREIDTVRLDADELSTPDLSYTVFEQIGQFDIPAPTVDPVTLDITQVGGLATYVPGAVPATAFSITNDLSGIDTWSSVGITNGQAYVVVANNLGFEITANSVELWDVTYNRSIGTQAFPTPIADGDIDSVLYDLSGKTISNRIQARITALTQGGLVLSTSGKEITTAMRFVSDLTVGAATGEIPALNRSFSQALTLAEQDIVHRATLSGGSLSIAIGNQTNLGATLDLSFPDIRNGGIPLTLQRTVGPISSSTVNINLTGYEIVPVDLTPPQEIRVEVTATVPSSAPQHVTVAQSQQFIVDATLSSMTFDTVTGVFGVVGSTLDPTRYSVDVPDGFDSAQVVSAVLTLAIENGVQLPGSLNLTLLGNNGKTLTVSGAIDPAASGSSVITQLIDTTVADFLSPFPSQITISGGATFGDGVSVGSVRIGDYIRATVDILAPLEVILPRTVVTPDIESEFIDPDDFDPVNDHVLEARLIYNAINRLPLGATINLFLSGDSATVLTNPQASFVDEIYVVAAPTVGGIASDTVSTGYLQVVIDSVDVEVLKNDTLYIGTQIVLDDTNGLPVKLTASDYLTLTGRIEVEYRFDGAF